jgi:hypothetical protein
MAHPQKLFYDPVDGRFVSHQEKAVQAAALMAKVNHV